MNGGPEIFSFSEAGESYDPAAFERFKERVRKNAKFIAALRKQEQRQKKKEDQLLAILMKFFKSFQKQGILLLASRALEQNVPPSFVLAVLLLGNEELKREASPFLALPKAASGVHPQATTDFSLLAQFSDESLPLRAKAEIEEWGRLLFEAAESQPFRLLETALEKTGKVKSVVLDFMANVFQEFLESFGLTDFTYDTIFSFCEYLVHGIFSKIKNDIENRKFLPEEL